MSWIDRLRIDLSQRPPKEVNEARRAKAAVAIVLTSEPTERILMIQRAEIAGDPWSGQMAFPGGRASDEDTDLLATATRETAEELHLVLQPKDCLGVLDDLAPLTPVLPPISVRPFVFTLQRPAPLQPNQEVALATWVPLATLMSADTYRPFVFDRAPSNLTLPGYHLDEGVVWGMSERILTPLLQLITDARA